VSFICEGIFFLSDNILFLFFYLLNIVVLFETCEVTVDEHPDISATNIRTFGVSVCSFYLLYGTFKDDPFCYLNHNVDRYEKRKISNALYCILDDILTTIKKKFSGKSSVDIIDNLNNLHLFVGGGEMLNHDIVREACALLVNTDEKTAYQFKKDYRRTNIIKLFEKLINNVTILKVISYALSDEEETGAKSKYILIKFRTSILSIF